MHPVNSRADPHKVRHRSDAVTAAAAVALGRVSAAQVLQLSVSIISSSYRESINNYNGI